MGATLRIVDTSSVLIGFDDRLGHDAQEKYLAWVRAVAEARWFGLGIEDLPWWKGARDANEIVGHQGHPEARTFDNQSPEDDRVSVTIEKLREYFELYSGHSIEDLASPLRRPDLIQGRIELTTLAVAHYGLRSSEVADLIGKHPSSTTRWMNLGLRQERDDVSFRFRLDELDRKISSAARNNESMRRVAP